MITWTTNEEYAFLCDELTTFKAIREKGKHYGKIKQFLNSLYARFVAQFPLKDGETPKKKRDVIIFVSMSGSADF